MADIIIIINCSSNGMDMSYLRLVRSSVLVEDHGTRLFPQHRPAKEKNKEAKVTKQNLVS